MDTQSVKCYVSPFSEPARADSENEHSAPDTGAEWCGSSDGKPSDVKTNYYLTQLREELGAASRRSREVVSGDCRVSREGSLRRAANCRFAGVA